MNNNHIKPAVLVLENGARFDGYAPVWQKETTFGEVVFNTGMTGYEETLTDPSYSGQILTFTFPIIGNYGVSDGIKWESSKIHVKGMICQTIYNTPNHYLNIKPFLNWLEQEKVPVIFGIDTRELTKVIRKHGVISGAFVFNNEVIPTEFPNSMEIDWVEQVTAKEIKTHGKGKYKIILIDCGSKENILRNLLKFDTQVKIVPFDYDYTNEEYDGIFLSNGPGDPKKCIKTIEILKKALAKTKPIYGICLGSQLMALAIGAQTYKLKFGHRGQNQPCMDLINSKCYLTSQNHGYAVDEKAIPSDWLVSYRNINDGTIAGIMHKNKPFKSVQFHPEAAPGPHDTFYFFEQFIKDVSEGKK
ncbi:MAG: glutamine-hydrolyzing carbamoyl-phosphate synthase small subunit [Neisseriaceae bacterium]